MNLLVLLAIQIISIKSFELIDYSREPYALVQLDTAFLYEENEMLLHVFNMTTIIEKFEKYKERALQCIVNSPRIHFLLEKCESEINQLTTHRTKRSLDFIGSAIKFIAGTPDHYDMMTVQNRINDLIENNNKMNIILSNKFENINGEFIDSEYLIEMVEHELSQMIHTINLAKAGILNTSILDLDEVREILKKEISYDAPLMELLEYSTVKIMQINSSYVVMIKYPKIAKKCMLYAVKPIELRHGKLGLEDFAANCNNTYMTVKNCKKYVATNICQMHTHTCTEELLNGINTNCTMVREHMLPLDEVDDGRIIVHGSHNINNFTRTGTYLILFNDSVTIDNRTFTNEKTFVSMYLRSNRPVQYNILDIMDSQDEELRMKGLKIIDQIPIQFEDHPIRSTLITIIVIIIIIIMIHYCLKTWAMYNAYAERREREKSNEVMKALFSEKLGTISFKKGES